MKAIISEFKSTLGHTPLSFEYKKGAPQCPSYRYGVPILIKQIRIHHFGPRFDKIINKLLLIIILRIDFSIST